MPCSVVLPIEAKYRSASPCAAKRVLNSSLLFVFASIAVLVTTGDVIAQQFAEQRGKNHDFRRTARMGVVGLVIGAVLKPWNPLVERIVPGTPKTASFIKMLLGQSLSAPVMIYFFFLFSLQFAGKQPHEIVETVQERYEQTLITNYKIWPVAQTLNFTFVPMQHRVGFVQIVAIFWNAYLSWMANKPSPDAAALTVKKPLEQVQ